MPAVELVDRMRKEQPTSVFSGASPCAGSARPHMEDSAVKIRDRSTGSLLGILCLIVFVPSCDSFPLGNLNALFGPTVEVRSENNTQYLAIPDLRSSKSRNLIEDILSESEPITNFGTNGAIDAHQTVTLFLPCNGDLELIAFNGADFKAGNSFPIGEVSANTRLRRDSDFDCGDVIRIRLDGGLFSFTHDVRVDRSNPTLGNVITDAANNQDNNDVADFLDDLFGR